MTRVLLILPLLIFGFQSHAETCADAYKRASDAFVSKLKNETEWAQGVRTTGKVFSGFVYAGCAVGTGGLGVIACVLPAGAVYYITDVEPRTAYLRPAAQIHHVYELYNDYKQGNEETLEVHALAQATGWSEQEALAEVARHMEAGDLCTENGEASVGYDELVTRLTSAR